MPGTGWLRDSLIYQIFVPSFADGDGDGIGDLKGVVAHLDHLQWLGVDAIWFNPCFASPFRDAGYDVADYLSIAPRYGTNEEMIALIAEARRRGIRVLLDLVAGHTSVAHPWFQASANDPADERYVWSDTPGPGFVPGPGTRQGYYLKNFFDEQPALNFGYARLDEHEPWRQAVDAPGPTANRQALCEVMAYWLDRGVAGFRVDMAYSLVKDDFDFAATVDLWAALRAWVEARYPDAVVIPENDYRLAPGMGARAGFDADFFLVIEQAHSLLFNNGGAGVLATLPDHRACYFDAGAPSPDATFGAFLRQWEDHQSGSGGQRLVVLPTADHDFSRLATAPRTTEQLGAAYAFLLTWGSIPSIYYGDEIGMRYLLGLPEREGSKWSPGFNRAGCRTPMQWDDDLPDVGFSTAPAEHLYLPQDPDPARPTVAAQRAAAQSPLRRIRRLVELRRATPELRPGPDTTVLSPGYPLVYLRGDRHLVVVNPASTARSATIPALEGRTARALEVSGIHVASELVTADPFGYGVFLLERR
ncbi:MAG: alpha-amylase family glycosyl hydrolase [Propionicimonas sp.]